MRGAAAFMLLALLALAGPPACGADEASDPRALRIADQVMEALGGAQRWQALPCLAWSFRVSDRDTIRSTRRHVWDKLDGRHRVEGVLRDGTPYVIVHTEGDTLSGGAWLGTHALQGDSLHTMIQHAHALWTNDTYWMLMPYKLRDPGVILTWEAEVQEGGRAYDKLAMRFRNVGMTPGDRYWLYVDRANHRIEKWDYVLEGQTEGPKTWTWEGWEAHEQLWFPTIHRRGESAILTNDVRTMTTCPPGVFDHP